MGKLKTLVLSGAICAVCAAPLPENGNVQTCSDACAAEYDRRISEVI